MFMWMEPVSQEERCVQVQGLKHSIWISLIQKSLLSSTIWTLFSSEHCVAQSCTAQQNIPFFFFFFCKNVLVSKVIYIVSEQQQEKQKHLKSWRDFKHDRKWWACFRLLRLYVLQGVCDLNVGSDDVSVGLRAARTLTAVLQPPVKTVETLSTRIVQEQHEQQAGAASREQHKLGHAQECSFHRVQFPSQLRSSQQRHAVEELAEKGDRCDCQEQGTLLTAGEKTSFRFQLLDAASYQKPQLEDVWDQKTKAQPSSRVWNSYWIHITSALFQWITVGSTNPSQQQTDQDGSQGHQSRADQRLSQQGVGRRIQS